MPRCRNPPGTAIPDVASPERVKVEGNAAVCHVAIRDRENEGFVPPLLAGDTIGCTSAPRRSDRYIAQRQPLRFRPGCTGAQSTPYGGAVVCTNRNYSGGKSPKQQAAPSAVGLVPPCLSCQGVAITDVTKPKAGSSTKGQMYESRKKTARKTSGKKCARNMCTNRNYSGGQSLELCV